MTGKRSVRKLMCTLMAILMILSSTLYTAFGLTETVNTEPVPHASAEAVIGMHPTKSPTVEPTKISAVTPTMSPTAETTKSPTVEPAKISAVTPTKSPTAETTKSPTVEPAKISAVTPTMSPTAETTKSPTVEPTKISVVTPTKSPTAETTKAPTVEPTKISAVTPTKSPTAKPTMTPSPSPIMTSAASPSPTVESTGMPLGNTDRRVLEAIDKQRMKDEAAFENAEIGDGKYVDFYFSGVQTLHGIFSSISLYCQMPEYADLTDATLRICYTASDVILEEYSTLTFYMNGTPFYSCHVTPSGDNEPVVLFVNVPISLMQTGYNLLEIGSYVRLTDDEGCTDDFNGANWIRIADTTCLRISYEVAEDTDTLRYYPYPFISLMDQTGANAAVTYSDAADNAEIEAGLSVMANLSNSVSAQNDINFCRLSEAQQEHIIYFGLEKNSPAWILALLEEKVPTTGAVIQRAEHDGREYLVIVSQEEDALMEAAWFISDQTRVKQADDRHAYVSLGEAQLFVDAYATGQTSLVGQYTLKDVLGHGMSFSGPFHQETTLYLPVADDYVLAANGRFTFNIRYSENLDFTRSLMTVYWGDDIPIYSRKLSAEGAMGETVSFAVTADAAGTAATSMKIVFDLEIEDLDCTPRQINMPWAYVAENSTFYLPQGESARLTLKDLPTPFQYQSRLNNVMVVIPDEPTKNEMLLCGRTVGMLGIGSDPYGSLIVRRASEFSAEDADYNLLIIGSPAHHPLIQEMNPQLYFKYNNAMDALTSNEKAILSADYAKSVGVIQLLISPYHENRAALVLSAPTDEALNILTERVSNERLRWALEKEALLADGYGNASSYQFTNLVSAAVTEDKPTFTDILLENREPVIFLLAGMGCMLLVLLGVILVLLRVRSHKKDEE